MHSFIGAVAIHGIYTVATLATGSVKTRNYQPDFEAAWANVENFPIEVTFKLTASPFLLGGRFLGTALVYGLLLVAYERSNSD